MEDDHVKKMAEMDQAIEQLKETLPAITFSLYTALKEEGFSDADALELTKEWMRTMLEYNKR
jgi:hypothetical protein